MKSLRKISRYLKLIEGVPRIFWFNIDKSNYNEVYDFYIRVKNEYKEYQIYYTEIQNMKLINSLLIEYSHIIIVSTINFNDSITNDRILITDKFRGCSELEFANKLIKYYNSYSIPIELSYKLFNPKRVLLVSPGGCASQAIISFLKDYVTINSIHNNDSLEHGLDCNMVLQIYKPTHIVYLYGSIESAIRSLFRREWAQVHYVHFNTTKHNVVLPSNLYSKDYNNVPYTTFKEYIDIVIKTKTEPMGMIKHYESWKKVPGVFFIHYESFPKSDTLDEFLGLPKGTCSKFELKERTSVRQPEEIDEYLEIINSLEPW